MSTQMLRFSDEDAFETFKKAAQDEGFGGKSKPLYTFVMKLLNHYETTRREAEIVDRIDERLKPLSHYTPHHFKEIMSDLLRDLGYKAMLSACRRASSEENKNLLETLRNEFVVEDDDDED